MGNLSLHNSDSNQFSTPKPGRAAYFMQRLAKLIDSNIDDPDLYLDKVAKALHVSTMQLYRKVKKYAGVSPNQFIRTLKLQRSKQLLLSTDWNIAQIAYAVGYNDPNYFTRSFTQEYSISPSRFRNLQPQSSAALV